MGHFNLMLPYTYYFNGVIFLINVTFIFSKPNLNPSIINLIILSFYGCAYLFSWHSMSFILFYLFYLLFINATNIMSVLAHDNIFIFILFIKYKFLFLF